VRTNILQIQTSALTVPKLSANKRMYPVKSPPDVIIEALRQSHSHFLVILIIPE